MECIKKEIIKNKLECGKLYSVGYNGNGELGNGNDEDCKEIKEIEFFKNLKIIDIKSGGNHSLAISENGEIFSWGCNEYGQIGNGNYENQTTPIKIYKIKKI